MCTYYYIHFHHTPPCRLPIEHRLHYDYCKSALDSVAVIPVSEVDFDGRDGDLHCEKDAQNMHTYHFAQEDDWADPNEFEGDYTETTIDRLFAAAAKLCQSADPALPESANQTPRTKTSKISVNTQVPAWGPSATSSSLAHSCCQHKSMNEVTDAAALHAMSGLTNTFPEGTKPTAAIRANAKSADRASINSTEGMNLASRGTDTDMATYTASTCSATVAQVAPSSETCHPSNIFDSMTSGDPMAQNVHSPLYFPNTSFPNNLSSGYADIGFDLDDPSVLDIPFLPWPNYMGLVSDTFQDPTMYMQVPSSLNGFADLTNTNTSNNAYANTNEKDNSHDRRSGPTAATWITPDANSEKPLPRRQGLDKGIADDVSAAGRTWLRYQPRACGDAIFTGGDELSRPHCGPNSPTCLPLLACQRGFCNGRDPAGIGSNIHIAPAPGIPIPEMKPC